MCQVCYLCGMTIVEGSSSADHVVPRQFIKRPQPKAKGFDYGGTLPTHETCNNEFGPEVYSQKALTILRALHDENCFFRASLSERPDIKFMALNSDCFPGFSEQDLRFFKLIDATAEDAKDLKDSDYFTGKPKANLKKEACFVALSVLAKSAAALVVARGFDRIPKQWKIIAVPYVGAEPVDFDEIFGATKPFETDVKTWIRETETADWFIAYKAGSVLVYFLFVFSGDTSFTAHIKSVHSDADVRMFEAPRLLDLVNYEWKAI